jgi:hypothetical protein
VTGEKGAARLAYLAARFAQGGGGRTAGGADRSGAVIKVTLRAGCVRRRFPREGDQGGDLNSTPCQPSGRTGARGEPRAPYRSRIARERIQRGGRGFFPPWGFLKTGGAGEWGFQGGENPAGARSVARRFHAAAG